MPEWLDYATPEERQRLKEIDLIRDAAQTERIKIYDRCRKRMAKEMK